MKFAAKHALASVGMACLLGTSMPAVAETDEEKFALGKEVFLERAQPACGLCHQLADAETEGSVGPVLDDLRPSADRVRQAVVNGIGPMRPYTDLSEEEVNALSFYVAKATGGDK